MTGRPRRSPARRALLAIIGFYSRAISPALPPRCRFYPTCSAYAAEAIEGHGAARGTCLAVVRLVKCAPWHPGGVDPVPPSSGTGRAGCSSNPAVSNPAVSNPAVSNPAVSNPAVSNPAGEPAAFPADRAPRSASATPPAMRRAPQEESSVV